MLILGSVLEKRLTSSWKCCSQYVENPGGCGKARAYLCECVPPPPKVRVGNDADSLAELALDGRWRRDHEADEALLDGADLILRQLVVAFFVLQGKQLALGRSRLGLVTYHVVESDEVFEGERGGEAGVEG